MRLTLDHGLLRLTLDHGLLRLALDHGLLRLTLDHGGLRTLHIFALALDGFLRRTLGLHDSADRRLRLLHDGPVDRRGSFGSGNLAALDLWLTRLGRGRRANADWRFNRRLDPSRRFDTLAHGSFG